MTEKEIADQLFAAAKSAAAQAGRHFGEGTDSTLHYMTRDAAAHIMLISGSQAQADELLRVERKLRELIAMAVENARALTDYPLDLLGEQTFFAAKLRFCPCPPLC